MLTQRPLLLALTKNRLWCTAIFVLHMVCGNGVLSVMASLVMIAMVGCGTPALYATLVKGMT